jgi:hypothetical protein
MSLTCEIAGFALALRSDADLGPSIRSAGGSQMTITLNHTIVPAHDKEAAARRFAQLFGLGLRV